MNNIIIREAKLTDISDLLAIEQLIIEAERPYDENMKTEQFNYYDLQALINNDEAMVLVAETNETIIGSGYSKIKESLPQHDNKLHAFMGFMYVDPKYRGQGINKMIVEGLIDWSKQQGLSVACLTVYSENTSAIRAYNKAGFNEYLVEMRLNF